MDDEHDSTDSTAGYVYILTNPAYDWVKIGCTTRKPEVRARELSNGTGVPMPFEVAHSEPCDDCYQTEQQLHRRLEEFRVSSAREFFDLPVRRAISHLEELVHSGQVCLLSNPAFGGRYVKLVSTRDSPQQLAKQLSSQEHVPHPYSVSFTATVPSHNGAIDFLRHELSSHAVEGNETFLELNQDEAKARVVELLATRFPRHFQSQEEKSESPRPAISKPAPTPNRPAERKTSRKGSVLEEMLRRFPTLHKRYWKEVVYEHRYPFANLLRYLAMLLVAPCMIAALGSALAESIAVASGWMSQDSAGFIGLGIWFICVACVVWVYVSVKQDK